MHHICKSEDSLPEVRSGEETLESSSFEIIDRISMDSGKKINSSTTAATQATQSDTGHYRAPIIHVIGSRPAESYVKFSDHHVTWDKPETRDNHAQRSKSHNRHANRNRNRKFDSAMPNGPASNQLSSSYRLLDSESSDNPLDNPIGYHNYGSASSQFPAQGCRDIALLYPNAGTASDPLQEDIALEGDNRPSGGGKLKMQIVNGHMFVTQNSSEEDHTFKRRRHESYMFISLLVCACFNCPLGSLALCLSMKSQSLYDNGRKHKAKVFANVSLVTSMIGMITGVFTIIAVVFYLAHLQEQKKI